LSNISDTEIIVESNGDLRIQYINESFIGLMSLSYHLKLKNVQINNIVILEHLRDKGYGSKLMNKLFEICFEKGIKTINAKVSIGDEKEEDRKKFYYMHGFVTDEIQTFNENELMTKTFL